MPSGTTFRGLALVVALTILAALSPWGQDTSVFLERPPAAGAWAKYRITTTKPGQEAKAKPLNLSVTQEGSTDGTPSYTLELGPTKFASYRDGFLSLVLKRDAKPEEVLNPFLQALAVAYQEPEGAPFKLSASALNTLHNQAKDAKVERKRTDLGQEKAEDATGLSYACTKVRLVTTRSAKFMFKSWKSTEDGVYWFCDETPFRIVKAELNVVEVSGGEEKRKQVNILLKEARASGAATRFKAKPTKEKGVLGILFH